MSFRNANTPVWEPITTSDTAPKDYYGLMAGTAGTAVFKSEGSGSDITVTLAAGQQISGRVVLVKTTSTATLYGAKAS